MPNSRKSATIAKVQIDIANLKSVEPNLDMGNDVSIAALLQMIEETNQEIELLNTTLNTVTQLRRSIQKRERALLKLRDRLQAGIAVKYGKDSAEYKTVYQPTPKRRKNTDSDAGSDSTASKATQN
jgi:malate synthase